MTGRWPRWGRWLTCGCRWPWAHSCGRRNSPAPDPAIPWAPSPYSAGACQWRCMHETNHSGADPLNPRPGWCQCWQQPDPGDQP